MSSQKRVEDRVNKAKSRAHHMEKRIKDIGKKKKKGFSLFRKGSSRPARKKKRPKLIIPKKGIEKKKPILKKEPPKKKEPVNPKEKKGFFSIFARKEKKERPEKIEETQKKEEPAEKEMPKNSKKEAPLKKEVPPASKKDKEKEIKYEKKKEAKVKDIGLRADNSKPKKKDSESLLPPLSSSSSSSFFSLFRSKKITEKEGEVSQKSIEKIENAEKEVKKTHNKIKKDHIEQSSKPEKKKIKIKKETNLLLKRFLLKAGVDTEPKLLRQTMVHISWIISLALLVGFVGYEILNGDFSLFHVILMTLVSIFLFTPMILFIVWLFFLLYLDIKAYKRVKEMERVFPDFLQLASANMRAGMPIDRALWYAIRPQFGVLAKEIEAIAKNTTVGADLADALQELSQKYDSLILQRSVDLLIEGIEAGGNISELLLKIADGVNNMQLLKREMVANVSTYTIFITFASTIIAPVMFSVSYHLISIVNQIVAGGDFDTIPNAPLQVQQTIGLVDFRIFSMVYLAITALMSAVIISTIKRGTVKEGLNLLPIYVIIALSIYLIALTVLSSFLSGMFA